MSKPPAKPVVLSLKNQKYLVAGQLKRLDDILEQVIMPEWHLKRYDLEEFVADLFRAMEYRTTVSAHGGDSGFGFINRKRCLLEKV